MLTLKTSAKFAAAALAVGASFSMAACSGGSASGSGGNPRSGVGASTTVSWKSITDDASAKAACRTLTGVTDPASAAAVYKDLSGKDVPSGETFGVVVAQRPGTATLLQCQVGTNQRGFIVSFAPDKSAHDGTTFNGGVTAEANGFTAGAWQNTMSPNVQSVIQTMVSRLTA
ncbi:hypothetical protein [Branchiibius cervicis]|uniref:DUF3558 domain-containing protein n=1 Tax=Branchiibius cervicis TaxID=908252 RepID=A0ABW2ATN8_9MICO